MLLFVFKCDVLFTEVVECNYKNGGCLQYCQDLPGGAGVQCGCADGFELESDGRSCSQTGGALEHKKTAVLFTVGHVYSQCC